MEFDPNYDEWYDFFGSEEETSDETFIDETPMFENYYGGE